MWLRHDSHLLSSIAKVKSYPPLIFLLLTERELAKCRATVFETHTLTAKAVPIAA